MDKGEGSEEGDCCCSEGLVVVIGGGVREGFMAIKKTFTFGWGRMGAWLVGVWFAEGSASSERQ